MGLVGGLRLPMLPTALQQGLVGYWPFSEGTGNVVGNHSSNGYTGTWQGTLGSQWGVGPFGGAGVFNGTDNGVYSPNTIVFDPNTSTLQAWVYPTATPTGYAMIVGCEHDASNSLMLRFVSGTLQPQLQCTGGNARNASISLNTWTHLVGVCSNLVATLYINGVATNSSAITAQSVFTNKIMIGENATFTPRLTTGRITQCAYWRRALSAADVQALYNNSAGLQLLP